MHHEYSILTGYLKVVVTGSSCERFFQLCVRNGISLCQVKAGEDQFTMMMKASDFLKIKRLVKKCRIHISIYQKCGFPFFLKQHRKRKFLLLGWIWCCFFLYLLSLHIWKIEIHGNQEITREQLMQYLEDSGIGYGSLKRKIDCKQTAADIRNAFPEVTWVAVKKEGTLLDINLKENTDSVYPVLPQKLLSDTGGTSLIAACDGIVADIVTRSGVACVKSGQRIQKGDLLVSGVIPITNDENEVISRRYVQADADVILEMTDTCTITIPREQTKTIFSDETDKYYLKFFHLFFSTKFDLSKDTQAEVLQEEHQAALFSDFYLPVIWGKIRVRSYQEYPQLLADRELKKMAMRQMDKIIAEKKEKGVQILKKNVRIEAGMTFCKCICTFVAYTSDTERIPSMQEERMENNEEGTSS